MKDEAIQLFKQLMDLARTTVDDLGASPVCKEKAERCLEKAEAMAIELLTEKHKKASN